MEPQAKSSEKRDSPDHSAADQDSAPAARDPIARAEVPLPLTANSKPTAAITSVNSPSQDAAHSGPDEVVLFVSGFGYGLNDESFAALFTSFGKVVSCKVLVDIPTGKSKGCGLIRLENRKAAEFAISNLHGTTLPGQVTTLTVKYADTPEEKVRRRQRQLVSQRYNPMANRASMPYQMNQMQFPSVAVPGYSPAPNAAYPSYPVAGAAAAAAAAAAATAAGNYQQSFQQLQLMQEAMANATVQGQFTLYVGGLPQGVDEGSLYKMFSPYGAVAGVKVVVDSTNPALNRGFAFVNFFRYEEATAAIYALNGQQFGEKRLQVSFKTASKSKTGMPNTSGPRAPGAATGGYTGPAAQAAAAYGTAYPQQYTAAQQGAAGASATSYQQYPYGGTYQ